MQIEHVKASKCVTNTGQIEGLPKNPRQWTQTEVDRLAKSLIDTPELFEARPLLVTPWNDKYIVLGGNMRLTAAKQNKTKDVPAIIFPADTPTEKLREIVIKDNSSFGDWDYDELANKWDDLPLTEWGVPVWNTDVKDIDLTQEEQEIERKRKEFEERMAAGEDMSEDEEYQEFLAKFEAKKTTDDCYTPEPVYEAVANWVANEYHLNRAKFVRPFYPNGDYRREEYPQDCVVVDNPPFSILAEILQFYTRNKVRFFLFAPSLTLFSSSSSSSSTALPCGVSITYENGANVATSFLTNLEPKIIRLRSCPSLYTAVKEANDANLASIRKQLPKYAYDHHIITSPFVAALSRLGVDFVVPVADSEPISQLESQKESGKAIFGKGYIVSDRVFAEREKAEREKAEREKAEREKAEREKAEREKAERWELSPRELAIIDKLNSNNA